MCPVAAGPAVECILPFFSICTADAEDGLGDGSPSRPKSMANAMRQYNYHEMRRSGVKADGHGFVAALQACACAVDLDSGRSTGHGDVLHSGIPTDLLVDNCLVKMYAKMWQNEILIQGQVFDSMNTKDVVTWNALIAGFAHQGLVPEALVVYGRMVQEGQILAFRRPVQAPALYKRAGSCTHRLLDDVVVGTCLVDMYAECGELEDARQVFDSMNRKNVVTWTVLISGYGTCDEGLKALACFEEM